MSSRIVSPAVVNAVERYIDEELDAVAKFDNRELLDDSGAWNLHVLAATIYAIGFENGEAVAMEKDRCSRRRERSRAKEATTS